MTWPDVAVMLLTYNRMDYALQTLEGLKSNLQYSGNWRLHIADDGSPGEYLQHLVDQAGMPCTYSNSEQRGYGANYNLATQTVHNLAEIILPIEDDWLLTRPLDLDPLVRTLLEDERISCIRLGYVGYTQELRATFIWSDPSQMHFLLFDPTSPEHHVWAGHPRLETRTRQREVGGWPEGVDPGTTELNVSYLEPSRKGVVWPADLIAPRGNLFHHIGTIQARTDQQKVEANG